MPIGTVKYWLYHTAINTNKYFFHLHGHYLKLGTMTFTGLINSNLFNMNIKIIKNNKINNIVVITFMSFMGL